MKQKISALTGVIVFWAITNTISLLWFHMTVEQICLNFGPQILWTGDNLKIWGCSCKKITLIGNTDQCIVNIWSYIILFPLWVRLNHYSEIPPPPEHPALCQCLTDNLEWCRADMLPGKPHQQSSWSNWEPCDEYLQTGRQNMLYVSAQTAVKPCPIILLVYLAFYNQETQWRSNFFHNRGLARWQSVLLP